MNDNHGKFLQYQRVSQAVSTWKEKDEKKSGNKVWTSTRYKLIFRRWVSPNDCENCFVSQTLKRHFESVWWIMTPNDSSKLGYLSFLSPSFPIHIHKPILLNHRQPSITVSHEYNKNKQFWLLHEWRKSECWKENRWRLKGSALSHAKNVQKQIY